MQDPHAVSLARAGLLGNPAPLGFAGEVLLEEWKLDPFWFALGMLGQAVFFSRFLVQWIASERAGRSYIP